MITLKIQKIQVPLIWDESGENCTESPADHVPFGKPTTLTIKDWEALPKEAESVANISKKNLELAKKLRKKFYLKSIIQK